jgi:hypothetical protein
MAVSHTRMNAAGMGVVAIAAATIAATAAFAAKAPLWVDNCTALNKKYEHGVGKIGARDKTSGERVTTFRRSNALYATAMRWNKTLDRDKDGIACESA